MNILDSIFGHKHSFEFVEFVYHPSDNNQTSACPNTAKVYRCRCGEEIRQLTPAGEQQVYDFGDNMDSVLGKTRS